MGDKGLIYKERNKFANESAEAFEDRMREHAAETFFDKEETQEVEQVTSPDDFELLRIAADLNYRIEELELILGAASALLDVSTCRFASESAKAMYRDQWKITQDAIKEILSR